MAILMTANWRPITIYSILRRIIERVLDKKLRSQIDLNINQRGFVNGISGCHVNTKLIDACLRDAKKNNKSCSVVFLDISKAFDRIGHNHIHNSLISMGVSSNLSRLIMALLTQNKIKIEANHKHSKDISINCGVPQGGPLSPILFNIAINFIYDEICEPSFANIYGYQLYKDLDAVCLSGFADDQAITTRSATAALRVVELVQNLFKIIGLSINPRKSSSIRLEDGKLSPGFLQLLNNDTISCISENERIRYLGCSFVDQMIFDYPVIQRINSNLEKLTLSPLLKPDQKLNILNQYIFPMLTYPIQTAPLRKIPKYITEGLDIIIRRTVKSIIGIPASSCNDMLYASRKYRGLGILCTKWEVQLQHFSIASRLSNYTDELFGRAFDCEAEMNECKVSLAVEGSTVKQLRSALRENSFKNWCNKPWQGLGVLHFKNYTPANNFIHNKNSLSSSEWIASIKLNINYANLNGVPGNTHSSILCRRCGKEKETPAHVIGSCKCNSVYVTSRHHKIKNKIANLLREKDFICFDEVHAVDSFGNNRYSDIIAFDNQSDKAYIIDPTIRFETNDKDQDHAVQLEKQTIYDECIPFYKDKYRAQYGDRTWKTIGLWFGSRGSISNSVISFFNDFKLDKKYLTGLSESIILDSLHILHHHVYG